MFTIRLNPAYHIMYRPFLLAAALTIAASIAPLTLHAAGAQDERLFERRTYLAAPGKFEELHARFREHTQKLFEKHGIAVIGYWVPTEEKDGATNTLIYMLAFANRAEHDRQWKEFGADPDWQAVWKASEANGKLVTKVESVFLKATDYSPTIADSAADAPRLFELRTYVTPPGKLADLHVRFRDHTVELFRKHGMTNVGYWTPIDEKDGADNTLFYIVAHHDRAAAKASWKAFVGDPDWVAAKAASEVNGPLTTKVSSVFAAPTDYSPTK